MGGTNVRAGVLVLLALLAACGEVTSNEDAGLCAEAACDDSDGSAQGRPGYGRHKKAQGGAGTAAFPCAVCARAEACCKAAGGADCNHAAACASATGSAQQFYLASCRAALEAWSSGAKTPADVCAF